MHDPLWFLVLGLFLPRVALFLGWWEGWTYAMQFLPAVVLWAIVPRLLILITIYRLQGVSTWFLIHLVVAVLAWSGGGTTVYRRRRRVQYVD